MSKLPEGWFRSTIGESFRLVGGGTPKTDNPEYWGGSIPWITSADISVDHHITIRRYATEAGVTNSAANAVSPGAILVATRVGLGKSAVADKTVALSQDCQALVPTKKEINPQFMMYQIETLASDIIRKGRGTTINGITKTALRELPITLAPLDVQRAVVAAIESYLSRLDNATENLKAVQAKLKRYRASVLKAAVEGRLVPTEAELARKEGRDYEPASVLLESILKERKRRWIEDAADKGRAKAEESAKKAGKPWTAEDNAKTLENERAKAAKKYVEPVAPDTEGLPELPEGWCWATVDQLAYVQGGLTKGKKRKPGERIREIPYLRVANVQRMYLDLSEMKTIDATLDEIQQLRLERGDVLFNEGGDRDKLGRGWIWEGAIENCIHQNHVFRARPVHGGIVPEYLSYYGNTEGRDYFFDHASQSVNLASINMTMLKALPVALPPRVEQTRILSAIQQELSIVDSVQGSVDASARRTARMRQAILRSAFNGSLGRMRV